MKLLRVSFENLVGEAVGFALLNGITPQEIAAELRNLATSTEQRAAELVQTVQAAAGAAPSASPSQETASAVPELDDL